MRPKKFPFHEIKNVVNGRMHLKRSTWHGPSTKPVTHVFSNLFLSFVPPPPSKGDPRIDGLLCLLQRRHQHFPLRRFPAQRLGFLRQNITRWVREMAMQIAWFNKTAECGLRKENFRNSQHEFRESCAKSWFYQSVSQSVTRYNCVYWLHYALIPSTHWQQLRSRQLPDVTEKYVKAPNAFILS